MTTDSETGLFAAYADAAAYVTDLLRKVDLLLHRETVRHRRARPDADGSLDIEWLRFAAITDEEVDHLLGTDAAAGDPSVPEIAIIDNALAQLALLQSQRAAASSAAGISIGFLDLVRLCGLSALEADVLALCLAPEVDRRYERLYGYLHDDMTRRRPSIGLVLDVCSGRPEDRLAAHAIFAPHAPLIRHQLVHVIDEAAARQPVASRSLRLDERMLSFVAGEDGCDPRVAEALARVVPISRARNVGASGERAIAELLSAIQEGHRRSPTPDAQVFYLRIAAGASEPAVVHELGRRLNVTVIDADCEQCAAGESGFPEALMLVFREAMLAQGLLHLRNIDRVLEQDPGQSRLRLLGRCLDDFRGPVVLSGRKHWTWSALAGGRLPIPVSLERPGYVEQIETWRSALAGPLRLGERELARLASLYVFTPAQVAATVSLASELAAARGDHVLTLADIERGCREQCRPDFGQMARKVEGRATWSDLVLPDQPMQQLRDICLHARHRSFVYGQWGFDLKLSAGRGLSALFAGPSGTGKTMSAEVIATDLGLDLYKVDLSQVISKYIGETEKNLHRIFQAAETGQAILFLDEADALFGKRSDVKDAHDRYANIEVAYLLQKMEEYEGITILATNLRKNIDEAFTRRIRFIVEFPFPEEEHRLQIWRGIWPRRAPLAPDVDLTFLATQFRLCGGSIRNAAVAAAFQASEECDAIQMRHLLQGAKRELQKIGRLVNDEDYGHA